MTVQIRDFTENDLPTLVRLLNDLSESSYEFRPFTEDALGSWIKGHTLKILMAEEDGKIVGTSAYHDGYWGEEIEWLTVEERTDRKLIEKTLVEEAEKSVRGETVFAGVDSGSPKIEEWVERGYHLEGGLLHMVSRLERALPEPRVPDGVTLRSLKQEDEKQLVDLMNAGFGWERVKVGDVQTWKTESPPFDWDWIHAAEMDGRIVSAVVAKPDTNYNKFFNGRRGYLGPAATLAEYRNRNLASALTVRAMNFLLEKRLDSVVLYTSEANAASVALLKRIGFEVGHNWKFMRKHFDR